jgi:hypothetical protein
MDNVQKHKNSRLFPTQDSLLTNTGVIVAHQPAHHHITWKTYKVLSLF